MPLSVGASRRPCVSAGVARPCSHSPRSRRRRDQGPLSRTRLPPRAGGRSPRCPVDRKFKSHRSTPGVRDRLIRLNYSGRLLALERPFRRGKQGPCRHLDRRAPSLMRRVRWDRSVGNRVRRGSRRAPVGRVRLRWPLVGRLRARAPPEPLNSASGADLRGVELNGIEPSASSMPFLSLAKKSRVVTGRNCFKGRRNVSGFMALTLKRFALERDSGGDGSFRRCTVHRHPAWRTGADSPRVSGRVDKT